MEKRQITLPGMRADSEGPVRQGTIKIDLDDQTAAQGMPINQKLYERLVNGFIRQGAQLRPSEKQFYVINNQLLQVLLSSKGCTGLLLSKCCRPDGQESIAFIALGDDRKPLQWQSPDQGIQEGELKSDVSSGEWIQGYTVEEIRRDFLKNAMVEEINFNELFANLATR